MKTIGIIHTTPATIASLQDLIKEQIDDAKVINILDDSILDDMRDGRNVEFVRQRWISYAKVLEQLGVDAVLSACSTVGAFAEEADRLLNVKVCRIDEAMCELAVERGNVISIFATLQSTLEPTEDLIRRKAAARSKSPVINTVLVEGAYAALMNDQREEHDRRIREDVAKYTAQSDVIVLAQASMASAIKHPDEKILTSPRLGIEKLKKLLTR